MIAPVRPERRHPEFEREQAAAAAQASAETPPPGPHPLEPFAEDLAELRASVVDYLTVQADRAKLQARQGALYAVLGALGAVVGATALIVATVLLLRGIAHGLADLFDAELWVGELVTGLGLLLIVGLATWIGIRYLTSASRKRTVDYYEHRRIERDQGYRAAATDVGSTRSTAPAGATVSSAE